MDLENEYYELIKKRESLMKSKDIYNEKLMACNDSIDYYIRILNTYLFEKTCFEENIASYERLLNRDKSYNLFDFPMFNSGFDKYCIKRIASLEKKIEEVDKKKKVISNLITIKQGQKTNLENKNKEVDQYIQSVDTSLNELADKKILIKK